jgi:hypothetical protein
MDRSESNHALIQSVTADAREASALTAAGQRRINLIWEYTQSIIAVTITAARIYAALWPPAGTGGEALSNAFFLIVGFYFSRTNHAAIGGVGPKATSEYTGR